MDTPDTNIDHLLERYLFLLDQYTALRNEVNKLQSSIHQNIARANYLSDRGPTRPYSQTDYDERMRASAALVIAFPSPENPPPCLPVEPCPTFSLSSTTTQSPSSSPLRQFGILVPPDLRVAHTNAGHLLPRLCRLASLDKEMQAVEIAVRRRRRQVGAGSKGEGE